MTQAELNEQKIKEFQNSVKINLNKAKICFGVSTFLVLLPALVAIVVLSIGAVQEGYSLGAFIGFGVLFVAVTVGSILCVREFNEVVQHPHRDNEKKNLYIFYIVVFCPPVRWILGSLLAGLSVCAYMTGWYFGLACIPNILGYCFVCDAYRVAKNKWKIEFANDIQASKDYKEKQKVLAAQQAVVKQHDKEVNTVVALLSKVGNKFFVKYYFELRDWSEPDILDIIQEDYSEETKLQRIRKGKEIFDKGLNQLALQRIADISNKTVDDETRQKANELLK